MALSDKYLSMLKTLKLPRLSGETIASLRKLEKQWQHWQSLERRYPLAAIAADQQDRDHGFRHEHARPHSAKVSLTIW